ncbi:DUF7694 domain-containing protein [Planktotalea sp.]|uniref:DUF7694 domain-containing protein n=1 Tax=Planktotalea sp. TaxID=2029877 RepID=UPI003D6B1AC3
MRQDYPDPVEMEIIGFQVMVDDTLGHLAVTHDGSITWDQLQAIKNAVWGRDARAIEVYPVQADVINNAPLRHLWRLGADDFCPDLLGRVEPRQTLEKRFLLAWSKQIDGQ